MGELYERLLLKTKHVKVWLGYAEFESNFIESSSNFSDLCEPEETKLKKKISRTRAVYSRAYCCMRETPGQRENALMVLKAWRDFELSCKTESEEKITERVKQIELLMPKKTNIKRTTNESTLENHWEYIFPDEETSSLGIRLLEGAKKWKR